MNQHETPEALSAAIAGARGRFQCDCRGVGADWEVAEVRRIATELLGTVDLIPRADQMAEEFEKLDAHRDGPRRRLGVPAGLGSRRAPRCSSSARCPRRSRTSRRDARWSTR